MSSNYGLPVGPVGPGPARFTGWRAAMRDALYGHRGFYTRAAPAAHFRTSAHVSPLFAAALRGLAERLDDALGRPDPFHVVDLGAGRAELLRGMLDRDGGLPERWRLVAVETRPAPDDLPDRISWQRFHPVGVTGLLVANELLDNVPLDVVEVDATGVPRLVEVDPATGAERIADRPDTEQSAWLERWWPLAGAETGRRAELGASRDAVWADAVSALRHGVAVAVDYGHDLRHRPAHGTLAGYLNGRQLPPVPDGSMDITAHVAMDAVAAAGEHAGADRTLRLSQRDALRRLGVSGARPPLTLASTDPTGYLRALTTAGGAAELIDPAGLGAFDWLVQSRDAPPDATEPLCQRTDTG